MHGITVVILLILGQPTPDTTGLVEPTTVTTQSSEDLKVWLLSRFLIDTSFDEAKMKDIEKRLDNMSERQLRILVEFYKDRIAKRDQAEKARQEFMQQELLNQAMLNKQQAEIQRDYLKREYDRRILQGNMEQNLLRQSLINQQRFMYGRFGNGVGGYNGGYGYGFGYRY